MRVSVSMILSIFAGTALMTLLLGGDANLQSGQEVHRKLCLRCHGEQGRGDGPGSKFLKIKPADWTDQQRMGDFSETQLFQVIKDGGEAVGKSKLMPGFASKLKDDEIADVIVFIKSLQEK